MHVLATIPFLEHPLENWIFIIALAVIAVGLNIFILIRSRHRHNAKKAPDDIVNPWEMIEKEKENIARRNR